MFLIFFAAGIIGGATLPALMINRNLGGQALTTAAVITVISCLLLAVAPGAVTGLVASALIGLVLLTALPVILTMVVVMALGMPVATRLVRSEKAATAIR